MPYKQKYSIICVFACVCTCNGTLNSKGDLNVNCLSIDLYNYLVGPNLHLAYALALIAEFNR